MEDQLPTLLRRRREELGLSRAMLSRDLDDFGYSVSGMGIAHWESGKRSAPIDDPALIEAISLALGLDKISIFQARGINIASAGRTPEGRLAAEIVDALPPDERTTAIDYLKIMQRRWRTRE